MFRADFLIHKMGEYKFTYVGLWKEGREREERKEKKKIWTDLCRSSPLSFRHRRWMMVRVGELRARGLQLLRVRP